MTNKEMFLIKGKEVEANFAKLFDNIRKPTNKEDMIEHWDINIGVKVDVKGLKKILRTEEHPNEDYHWIEIKGITGKLGWLYGQADYIAFETYDYFIIVNRERLRQWVESKVVKEFTEYPELYRLYRREGRNDVLTIIKTLDLCYLSSGIKAKL